MVVPVFNPLSPEMAGSVIPYISMCCGGRGAHTTRASLDRSLHTCALWSPQMSSRKWSSRALLVGKEAQDSYTSHQDRSANISSVYDMAQF